MRQETEPKFMRELHEVRAQLTREWRRMSPQELLASLRQVTDRLRSKNPLFQKK